MIRLCGILFVLLLVACSLRSQDSVRRPGLRDDTVRELKAVTVWSARTRIVMRPDGFLYQANNTIPIAGEKAADVLRRLPGVVVSPDGVPSLNGSNRIKVLIDGKPSEVYASTVADALRQLPSENIATIEVITHPSAKYEAEGVDGVIQITTRQPSQNATSGAIELTLGDRNLELEGSLAVRRNKWMLRADVNLYRLSLDVLADTYREGTGILAGTGLQQERRSQVRRNSENGGINLIRLVDSLTTWSVQYRITWNPNRSYHRYNNRLFTDSMSDSSTRILDNPMRRLSHSIAAGYNRRSKDKKTEYSLLLTGADHLINNGYQLTEEKEALEVYREDDRNPAEYRDMALQADYVRSFAMKGKSGGSGGGGGTEPPGEAGGSGPPGGAGGPGSGGAPGKQDAEGMGKLEAGARFTIGDVYNNNAIDVFNYPSEKFVRDTVRSGSFGLRNSIAAGYVSYSYPLGPYTIRAGLRYEHTHIALSANDSGLTIPSYDNWLPNVLVNRMLGRSHMVSAAYSQKIQRPFAVYLNPVVNYLDSLNIEHGNPHLQPVIIHHYTLSYTYQKNGWMASASVSLKRSTHNIEYIRTLQPGGVTESTWQNISSNTTYGVTGNVSYQGKHFSFSLNNTLQSVFFQTDGTLPEKRGLIFSSGGVFTYTFDHGYTLTAYTNLSTRSITLQGTTTGNRWYNILLDKSFRDGKLHIGARIDNPFSHYQYVTETTSSGTFYQQIRTRDIYRFFYLNLSYRFGRKEVKMPAMRGTSQEN